MGNREKELQSFVLAGEAQRLWPRLEPYGESFQPSEHQFIHITDGRNAKALDASTRTRIWRRAIYNSAMTRRKFVKNPRFELAIDGPPPPAALPDQAAAVVNADLFSIELYPEELQLLSTISFVRRDATSVYDDDMQSQPSPPWCELGTGQRDPFANYPVRMTDHSHEIMDFCMFSLLTTITSRYSDRLLQVGRHVHALASFIDVQANGHEASSTDWYGTPSLAGYGVMPILYELLSFRFSSM